MDRMGGFRKALPFTFIDDAGRRAWRCRAIPPFSGFFSKDEILADVAQRGGWHWILFVAGYVGAFLTADLHVPDDVPGLLGGQGARGRASSRHGHLPHAEVHTNPTDGEVEDTDIGFPGPEHYIAERAIPMKIAMGIAGDAGHDRRLRCRSRRVTDAIHNFLAPTFEGSKYYDSLDPSDAFTLRRPGLRRGHRPDRASSSPG